MKKYKNLALGCNIARCQKIKSNFVIALQLHQYNKRKEYNVQESIYEIKTAILRGTSARVNTPSKKYRMKSRHCIQREWTCYFNNLQSFNKETPISGTACKSKCTKRFNYSRRKATVSWGTFQSCPCLGKSQSSTTYVFLIMYLSLHWSVWATGHFMYVERIALLKFLFNNFLAIRQLASQSYKNTHLLMSCLYSV